MKINFSQTSTRTLVPITIDVFETKSPAQIVVSPSDTKSTVEPFSLTTHAVLNRQQAQFWLMQEGDYHVTVLVANESFVQDIHIVPQVFMPFWTEFGILFVFVSLLFTGVILWFSRKVKIGKKSY